MIFRYFVYKLVINWTSHCSNNTVLYSKLLGTCTEGYFPGALAVVVETSKYVGQLIIIGWGVMGNSHIIIIIVVFCV